MMQSNSSIPSRSYWHVVARQLRQEPVAMASAVVLLLIICAAVFAPWLLTCWSKSLWWRCVHEV